MKNPQKGAEGKLNARVVYDDFEFFPIAVVGCGHPLYQAMRSMQHIRATIKQNPLGAFRGTFLTIGPFHPF